MPGRTTTRRSPPATPARASPAPSSRGAEARSCEEEGWKGRRKAPFLFSGAFDRDQLAARGLLAQLDERRVVRRAVPLERLLHARELEQHQALGRPVSLQRLDFAAAHEELAAVLLNGGQHLLAIVLVGRGI